MNPNTKVLFHIGLHKTGTTSFQRALMLARGALREKGILYPVPPAYGSFTDQHADVPFMLREGKFADVTEYFRQVALEAGSENGPPVHLILFSSEEFSNLCYDEKALAGFKEIAGTCFGTFSSVATVRNLVDFTTSALRQRIDSGEMAPSQLASEKIVLEALVDVARKLGTLISSLGTVKLVDYEQAKASGDLNNFLARECVGVDAPVLQNLRLNVGVERDQRLIGLLLAQLRSLLATLRQSQPYAQDVQKELSELIDLSRVNELVRHEKAAEFAKFYETCVSDRVRKTYDSNRSLIRTEMSRLSPALQQIMLRGLF